MGAQGMGEGTSGMFDETFGRCEGSAGGARWDVGCRSRRRLLRSTGVVGLREGTAVLFEVTSGRFREFEGGVAPATGVFALWGRVVASMVGAVAAWRVGVARGVRSRAAAMGVFASGGDALAPWVVAIASARPGFAARQCFSAEETASAAPRLLGTASAAGAGAAGRLRRAPAEHSWGPGARQIAPVLGSLASRGKR